MGQNKEIKHATFIIQEIKNKTKKYFVINSVFQLFKEGDYF
jgi:hypothetical protein